MKYAHIKFSTSIFTCDFEILLFINKNVNIKAKKIKDD